MPLLLQDLDPAFLAWLRKNDYVNGMGPRTIKLGLWTFRSPFQIPTPGCTWCFEQHDLDHLLGGIEKDRLDSNQRLEDNLKLQAEDCEGLYGDLIRAAAPRLHKFCDYWSGGHFRYRVQGPRTQDELKVELRYTVPV